jgi:hypothetical protein
VVGMQNVVPVEIPQYSLVGEDQISSEEVAKK